MANLTTWNIVEIVYGAFVFFFGLSIVYGIISVALARKRQGKKITGKEQRGLSRFKPSACFQGL